VYVFSVLRNLGDLDVINLAVIIQMVEDGADHIFKCRGGGKTGAAEDIGCGVSNEAADRETVFHEAVANASDEGGGTACICEYGRELGYVNGVLGEACALDTDGVIIGFLDNGDDVEVNGSGENLTVVVVCVVAADLTASRDGEYGKLVCFAENGFEFVKCGVVTCLYVIHASAVIKLCEDVLGFFKKIISVEHGVFSILPPFGGCDNVLEY
jgi:hypothetical protein